MKREEKARIRELIATGMEYAALATKLNEEGIKTQQGKPWTTVNLSHYARTHLKVFRFRKKRVRGRRMATKSVSKRKEAKGAAGWQPDKDFILDVLTSNMSKANKMTLIEKVLS